MTHDPGGRQVWPLLPGVRGSAIFSDGEQLGRFVLWREWGPPADDYMLWCGMNPSMARADVDDPTVRKEQVITARLGIKRMAKVNLSAYRATHPSDVRHRPVMDLHDENMRTIIALLRGAHTVVAAWGKPPPVLAFVVPEVLAAAAEARKPLWCLGTTVDGYPRHPSRVANATPLAPYEQRRIISAPRVRL